MSLNSFAWQVAQLSTEKQRPLLLIVQNNRELERLSQCVHFFNPSIPTLAFPDWETLPYERLSPTAAQASKRLQTLSQLSHCTEGIIIAPLASLLQRLAPRDYVMAYVFQFSIQDQVDLSSLIQQLVDCGYQRVSAVLLAGTFAVRGDIVDIFPCDTMLPFRIHLNINRVENLYYFDPSTHAPHAPIQSIRIIPSREFLLSDDSIQHFKQAGYKQLGQKWLNSPITRHLSTTSCTAGIEYYLPLFFQKTDTLIDYLPRHTHWLTALDLQISLRKYWTYIESRYTQLNSDIEWPILPPSTLYQTPRQLTIQLDALKSAQLTHLPIRELPEFSEAKASEVLSKLKQFLFTLSKTPQAKVLFSTTRLSQQTPLLKKLSEIAIYPSEARDWQTFLQQSDSYQTALTPVNKGFYIQKENICIIPETAWQTTQYVSSPRKPASPPTTETMLSDLAQLKIGAYIIHMDHGIGQYLGLKKLAAHQQSAEFVVLAYADNTKLYVPIEDSRYIAPYIGQENPALDHLNSSRWKKTKQKAIEQVKDTAAELLDLYAKRAQARGEKLLPPSNGYQSFVEAFPFEATLDQKTAMDQIIQDLCGDKPMDRLICGDVGFGKTELAMRAAFLAVQSGKQVAILAPTTLLVEQHYRNFRERFSDFAVRINWLSRFRTQQDSRSIKAALSKGTIDIIIGTHALLSGQIAFKALGLLVIDEEHHFGVQQKERLALFKAHIHVLTLTATPIPRTLQTALSGLREFSLITTPPSGRLSIQNFIIKRDPTRLREAITRELLRGGQVYFVHNRITSLVRTAREIQTLVPEARIEVAHGQLSEQALEACMESFYQQQCNVLVCTSIIETGLDIPTANTLIVDRADHFGLAQLYQLRGRIGRSHHQAYAYFLISDESVITQDAKKRLKALNTLSQLGSGFNLAMQDLDIRGAGEFLGDKQSGALQAIGFPLYMELLERTIDRMKSGQADELVDKATTKVDLKIPAFIPDAYLPDVALRLNYYKRISAASTEVHLSYIQQELLDQYGTLPEETTYLFLIRGLKYQAQTLGISKIEGGPQGGWIEFSEHVNINTARIITLIQEEPVQFKLLPNSLGGRTRLAFHWEQEASFNQRIVLVGRLLSRLMEPIV